MKNVIIILFATSLISQTWKPYHVEELNKYKEYDYSYIIPDSLASIITIANNNRTTLTHEIIGYLPYWEYEHYPSFNYNLLTQINFFSVELSPNGNIQNTHNWENLDIVEYAHSQGVKIKLCATLFGQSELEILLSNPTNRNNAINNLLNLVLLKNADGIDIDFELVPYNQRDNLVLFMQELSTAFHNEIDNPIITMATPAIDWSNAWDYNSLAQITDGLFIMGYNYFYSGSETAGPVSPLGGYYYELEYTINDYITKTNGQVDKLILGLPYHGYDWPVENSISNSETTGPGIARFYSTAIEIADEYGYTYDDESNTPWSDYYSDNWQQCWYDDSLSLSEKYNFAKNQNLQGVGIWALGYDNGYVELWDNIDNHFSHNLIGDLNFDNILNVQDIILLVNIILDIGNSNSIADINTDGTINILDVIELINLIFN